MCENAKILCPYCLTREIDPAQAICSACYSKEDKLERGSWDEMCIRDRVYSYATLYFMGVIGWTGL